MATKMVSYRFDETTLSKIDFLAKFSHLSRTHVVSACVDILQEFMTDKIEQIPEGSAKFYQFKTLQSAFKHLP